MKEFNVNEIATGSSVLDTITRGQTPREYGAYVGMDVHQHTIAIAVALPGRAPVDYRGEIANKPKTVAKWIARLTEEFGGESLLFCYEAGPCGFHLYHQIMEIGYDCQVIAPSKIPSKAGERIKTDRRGRDKIGRLSSLGRSHGDLDS